DLGEGWRRRADVAATEDVTRSRGARVAVEARERDIDCVLGAWGKDDLRREAVGRRRVIDLGPGWAGRVSVRALPDLPIAARDYHHIRIHRRDGDIHDAVEAAVR